MDEGHALFQGTPGAAHLNPMGTVHGSWYATLLDSALGCAVHAMMPPGRAYTTAELGVNLVRAIGAKAPRLRAEGKVIHCGRQLATAEAPVRPRRHLVRARDHHLPHVRPAADAIIQRMRLLHTMLRVGDLQRSIDFYTRVLGMKLLRTTDRPEQKYSLAFVGYGSNPEHAEIELTYNYGVDKYELGTAYGHIALGVPDAYAACEKIRAAGGAITREPGPVQGGSTVIAFVTDPDGYKIELIQRDS